MNKILYSIALVALTLFSSCSKDLDPTLAQQKELEGNINTDQDIYGVLKGAYNRMTTSSYYGRNVIINDECRSDNTFANGNSGRFSTEAAFAYNQNSGVGVWTQAYRVISSANLILGVDKSTLTGDEGQINHYYGQALALRALAHFDLMRNYGQQYVGGNLGVAYVTQFKGNVESPKRNTVDEVKTAIYKDLDAAYEMMDGGYDNTSKEFISKTAVMAIKSKVATYFNDWDVVKIAAKKVIDSDEYQIVSAADYVKSFSIDNAVNSVFELAFSGTDNVSINGLAYIYRGDSYGDIAVYPSILGLFKSGDVRADILGDDGTGYLRNMGKYPDETGLDNVSIIRYEEIILDYAEALANTGGDATTVLNMLRLKRGVPALSYVTVDDVLLERRKELMFEGFRYDDMVRTGMDIPADGKNLIDPIPSGDHRMAFPIPVSEIDANSNMVQNDGY